MKFGGRSSCTMYSSWNFSLRTIVWALVLWPRNSLLRKYYRSNKWLRWLLYSSLTRVTDTDETSCSLKISCSPVYRSMCQIGRSSCYPLARSCCPMVRCRVTVRTNTCRTVLCCAVLCCAVLCCAVCQNDRREKKEEKLFRKICGECSKETARSGSLHDS